MAYIDIDILSHILYVSPTKIKIYILEIVMIFAVFSSGFKLMVKSTTFICVWGSIKNYSISLITSTC